MMMTPGVLEDVFSTRTDRNAKGTITTEWNRVLLWRDLQRLISEGAVEAAECPYNADQDSRERRCFRDIGNGDVYIYIAGWERGSPEFRKQN
jgi:hypothetical protein